MKDRHLAVRIKKNYLIDLIDWKYEANCGQEFQLLEMIGWKYLFWFKLCRAVSMNNVTLSSDLVIDVF